MCVSVYPWGKEAAAAEQSLGNSAEPAGQQQSK